MASVNTTAVAGARFGNWRRFAVLVALIAAVAVGIVIGNAISDRSVEQPAALNPTGGSVLPEYAIPELTKAQAADAARWTGLADALTKPDTFSPELARAVASAEVEAVSAPHGIIPKVDTFSPELARAQASVVTPDTFSPELARVMASLPKADSDEAASGLLIGARHFEDNFDVGLRFVGESDMTLEEYEAQGLTMAQQADAGRYDGNTYGGVSEDQPEESRYPNAR